MAETINKYKLIAVILATVGMHSGALLLSSEHWRVTVGLLLSNLCINIAAYLAEPHKSLGIQSTLGKPEVKVEKSEQVD